MDDELPQTMLSVTGGPDAGRDFKIIESLLLKRDDQGRLELILDPEQAELIVEEVAGGAWLKGGSPELRRNGHPIERPVPLEPGDRLSLGKTSLVYTGPGAEADEARTPGELAMTVLFCFALALILSGVAYTTVYARQVGAKASGSSMPVIAAVVTLFVGLAGLLLLSSRSALGLLLRRWFALLVGVPFVLLAIPAGFVNAVMTQGWTGKVLIQALMMIPIEIGFAWMLWQVWKGGDPAMMTARPSVGRHY